MLIFLSKSFEWIVCTNSCVDSIFVSVGLIEQTNGIGVHIFQHAMYTYRLCVVGDNSSNSSLLRRANIPFNPTNLFNKWAFTIYAWQFNSDACILCSIILCKYIQHKQSKQNLARNRCAGALSVPEFESTQMNNCKWAKHSNSMQYATVKLIRLNYVKKIEIPIERKKKCRSLQHRYKCMPNSRYFQ